MKLQWAKTWEAQGWDFVLPSISTNKNLWSFPSKPWKFLCIFQSCLLSSFPGKVWALWSGYNGGIQRNNPGGRVAAGRESPKNAVSFPSLFLGLPYENTPALSFCLKLFSFAGIQSRGDNEKGCRAASGRSSSHLSPWPHADLRPMLVLPLAAAPSLYSDLCPDYNLGLMLMSTPWVVNWRPFLFHHTRWVFEPSKVEN